MSSLHIVVHVESTLKRVRWTGDRGQGIMCGVGTSIQAVRGIVRNTLLYPAVAVAYFLEASVSNVHSK